MSFSELPHTADIRFRIQARTQEALFTDAFEALMLTLFGSDRGGSVTREIQINADEIETLLPEFLSEVLFVCEVDGLVFSRAEITLNGPVLSAILTGEQFDHARHSGGTEVKGISYSGLAVEHDANGYVVDLIFDV